jgi:hypothetical protein
MATSTTTTEHRRPGMSQTVNGWAAMALGQPLEPMEYLAPHLGAHDVRVAVSHCGLCFTDIHGIDDFYRLTTYPFPATRSSAASRLAARPSRSCE